jgi:hypothetical protein
MKRIIILFGTILLSFNCIGQNLTLKDSLLMKYSQQELDGMSLREIQNAIRQVRGQKLIKVNFRDSLDAYGIPIFYDEIDTLEIRKNINNYLTKLSSDTSNYKKYIFPNTYVDIYNRFYDEFYSNIKTRELLISEFKTHSKTFGIDNSFDVKNYNNNTKRTYYLKDDKVVLIIIESGSAIFKEADLLYDRYVPPYKYIREEYFLKNGELNYYQKIVQGELYTGYGKSYDDIKNSSSTPVKIYKRFFFHRNNFLTLEGESDMNKNNWSKRLDTISLQEVNHYTNKFVIELRNYLAELKEFESDENDYLKSPNTSIISFSSLNNY